MEIEDYRIDWDELLLPYRQAVDELYLKFSTLKEQYRAKGGYTPIQIVYARVKSPDSILAKAKKHGYTQDEISAKIKDIAGIRIVTQFEEDIYSLQELIVSRNDIHITAVKDYFTIPKESGYKSIHLIAEYGVNTCNGAETVLCEIQLRTLAMDYWATIEHSLNYKYKGEIPQPIAEQLKSVAQSIEGIDRTMGKIREEIVDAQKLFQRKTDLVNQIIDRLNLLSRLGEKNRVKKYYKDFTKMREADNTVQLSLLNKELEDEIKKTSKKIKRI